MTNSQGKTESPKSVADDLWSKPDETSTNEKIKELCPIVITTIDCRPTKFKDANGDILMIYAGTSATRPCSFGGLLTGVSARSGSRASSLTTST